MKSIEASEQTMSQTGDEHINEPEKTSQMCCLSHRNALIALLPYLQDSLLLFLLIGSHISMMKTEKLPGGPRGSTLLMHSCSTLVSEEEGTPASSQEALTKEDQSGWKELRSGAVWNPRRPGRPGEWAGSRHKPARSSERRPPDPSPGETEEEGGRDAAVEESVMAGPRRKQQPIR